MNNYIALSRNFINTDGPHVKQGDVCMYVYKPCNACDPVSYSLLLRVILHEIMYNSLCFCSLFTATKWNLYCSIGKHVSLST